jgi:hypothetical protein
MNERAIQVSVAGLLLLVACVAINVWLFRVGFLAGLVGLNVSKHVAVAVICKAVGVNRRAQEPARGSEGPPAPHFVKGAP